MKILLNLALLALVSGCACNAFKSNKTAKADSMEAKDSVATANSATAKEIAWTEEMLNDEVTIKKIQKRLNDLGFRSGPVDGIKGPITTGALKRFQTNNGLETEGAITVETISALDIPSQNNL